MKINRRNLFKGSIFTAIGSLFRTPYIVNGIHRIYSATKIVKPWNFILRVK